MKEFQGDSDSKLSEKQDVFAGRPKTDPKEEELK